MLRTRSQRNKLCRKCPVARTADLFGDSCTLLIMRDLATRKRKFGELEDALGGMSPGTLTKKLRFLERHGLIQKEVYATHPRHLYKLTRKGEGFNRVIRAMRRFGERHL